MKSDELTHFLRDGLVLAESVEHLFDVSVREADTCRCVKRVLCQLVLVDVRGAADGFSDSYQKISGIFVLWRKSLQNYPIVISSFIVALKPNDPDWPMLVVFFELHVRAVVKVWVAHRGHGSVH